MAGTPEKDGDKLNPDQFSPNGGIPEDVERDAERLKIETSPAQLDAEVEAMVDQRKEMERLAKEAATKAVKERVTVSVTNRGRIRRNGPCPCGSGRKFKKCCLGKVKDPEDNKTLPSPKAVRAYMKRNQQANEE